MAELGGVPVLYISMGNQTIAASAGGTAAATPVVSSISCTYARSWQVWNMTGRNVELIIGKDAGTASIAIFCPGTASPTTGMGNRAPITIQQGMSIFARTTENTPITCSQTGPLVINAWA